MACRSSLLLGHVCSGYPLVWLSGLDGAEEERPDCQDRFYSQGEIDGSRRTPFVHYLYALFNMCFPDCLKVGRLCCRLLMCFGMVRNWRRTGSRDMSRPFTGPTLRRVECCSPSCTPSRLRAQSSGLRPKSAPFYRVTRTSQVRALPVYSQAQSRFCTSSSYGSPK